MVNSLQVPIARIYYFGEILLANQTFYVPRKFDVDIQQNGTEIQSGVCSEEDLGDFGFDSLKNLRQVLLRFEMLDGYNFFERLCDKIWKLDFSLQNLYIILKECCNVRGSQDKQIIRGEVDRAIGNNDAGLELAVKAGGASVAQRRVVQLVLFIVKENLTANHPDRTLKCYKILNQMSYFDQVNMRLPSDCGLSQRIDFEFKLEDVQKVENMLLLELIQILLLEFFMNTQLSKTAFDELSNHLSELFTHPQAHYKNFQKHLALGLTTVKNYLDKTKNQTGQIDRFFTHHLSRSDLKIHIYNSLQDYQMVIYLIEKKFEHSTLMHSFKYFTSQTKIDLLPANLRNKYTLLTPAAIDDGIKWLRIYYENFHKLYPEMSKISFNYILKHLVYAVTDRRSKPDGFVEKDLKEERLREIWGLMLGNMKNLVIPCEEFAKYFYKTVHESFHVENAIFSVDNYWKWILLGVSQLCLIFDTKGSGQSGPIQMDEQGLGEEVQDGPMPLDWQNVKRLLQDLRVSDYMIGKMIGMESTNALLQNNTKDILTGYLGFVNLIRTGLEILITKVPSNDELITSFYHQTKGFCTLLSKNYLPPKDQLNFLWSINYVVYIFNTVTNTKNFQSNFTRLAENQAFERPFTLTSTSLLKYFYSNATSNDFADFDHYKDTFSKITSFNEYLESVTDKSKVDSSNLPVAYKNIINIDLLLVLSQRELKRWHKSGVKKYIHPILYSCIENRSNPKILKAMLYNMQRQLNCANNTVIMADVCKWFGNPFVSGGCDNVEAALRTPEAHCKIANFIWKHVAHMGSAENNKIMIGFYVSAAQKCDYYAAKS